MQIVFWSNFHGQTATTTSMAMLAGTLALTESCRILLIQVHAGENALERCFVDPTQEARSSANIDNNGIDALIRLARNHKLTPDQIEDYALPLMKGSRLDLLQGTSNPSEALFYENAEAILTVLDMAAQTYDFVFVDAPSGLNNPLSERILAQADRKVICLNQNALVLERYFKIVRTTGAGTPEPLVCLGRYDDALSLNAKNIKRQYGYKQLVVVPQSSEIQEAMNQNRVLAYLARQLNRGNRAPETIKQIRESGRTLLKFLDASR